ncbi:hypothetical protein [Rathayibacter sp. AY1H2]|uniref:hypothetical protein n=1 Tax=Rathayibacter sp. AY1H2 TaxID=2080566 RepID=UPI000CE76D3C|nr:hypothetical protein [Rathayibacter sp. AY1H2]PPG84582.1 hypothetical protein C5C29_08780 [Rathayibacter sp. AY1H2]
MARPRNLHETKQLSVKLHADLYQRLAAIAYHELVQKHPEALPEDVNLSHWLRDQLVEVADVYEADEDVSAEALMSEYRNARRRELEAELNRV